MKTILDIFDVEESYKLPDKILKELMSEHAEIIIREVKENFNYNNIRDFFQVDCSDRKNLKQDFTPDCIATIVAALMKDGDVLDMCAGTGTLSIAAAKAHNIRICEQEFSEKTIPFALLSACVENMEGTISRADCLRNIVKESYELQSVGDISIPKKISPQETGYHDNVIMNPPFSMKFQDADQYPMGDFVIPKNRADYGFLIQGLNHLKDNGRSIAILPHGVLFRGNKEKEIRKQLIERHLVNAVIGLPDKLFLNTSIPVFLLILEQNSPNVLFIDASKDFENGSKQNTMTANQIHRIVNSFESRKDIEKYAHVADYKEIIDNDYNLNISRYVDTFEEEFLDVGKILNELETINKESKQIEISLYRMLGTLVGSEKDMKYIEKHREILNNNN